MIRSLNQEQKWGAPTNEQPMTAQLSVQPYTMCGLQPATDHRTLVSRPSPPTQPHKSSALKPSLENDIKDKDIKIDNRNKGPKKKTFKIIHVAKAISANGMDI